MSKRICGAWKTDAGLRVSCTLAPDHDGRHGWELDKDMAGPGKLPTDLSKFATSHLLNLNYAILSNNGFYEYLQATSAERGAFVLLLGAEIDTRVHPTLAARITDLEKRVSELENHPHGCTCTRCTG